MRTGVICECADLQTTKKKPCFVTSVIISDGAQCQGFQAFKHCHFGVGEEHLSTIKDLKKQYKPFALSFFSRSDSFHDLFYAVLLS